MKKAVFLITGGSRGIGAAVAIGAARQGFSVLLTYVQNESRAAQVVEHIRASGGEAEAIRADTADEGDIHRIFEIADRLGRLAVLVYNSGITGPHSVLAEAATDTIDRVLAVNLRGALLCAREAVRRMSTQRGGEGGSIVLISSRAAFYGSPAEFVWYAASKGGLDSLTSGLAREVATEAIRVNAVSPGPIDNRDASSRKTGSRREAHARCSVRERPTRWPRRCCSWHRMPPRTVTGANLVVAGGL